MPLRTFVLISPVTNLSDARYCAGMGADVLGFTLEPGLATTIPQTTFKELTGWVAGVQLLGEFDRLGVLEINQLAEENRLDYVQLNHLYPPEDVEKIKRPVILRITLAEEHTMGSLRPLLEPYFPEVEYFLITSEPGQKLEHEQLNLLRDLAQVYPVIIGFGITADNVLHVLDTVKPAGISLRGGSEIKPGLRDFEELADILEQLQPEE